MIFRLYTTSHLKAAGINSSFLLTLVRQKHSKMDEKNNISHICFVVEQHQNVNLIHTCILFKCWTKNIQWIWILRFLKQLKGLKWMAYCSWIACVFRMTLEDVTDLPPCRPHEVTGPAWKPHVMWLSLNPFNSTSVTLIKCKLKTTCTSPKAKRFLITAHTCKRWILNGIAYRSCHSTPQPAVHGCWCLVMWLLLISLNLSREPLSNLTFGVISCLHI